MSAQDKTRRPNILIITDELRDPPGYEPDEVKRWRKEVLKGEPSLRDSGITFGHHYSMAAACTPSHASYLTANTRPCTASPRPMVSLKAPKGDDMVSARPERSAHRGDWFRAGGYRTYYKGKWHASHPHIDAPTVTASCCPSMMMGSRSRKTSRSVSKPICSTSTDSRNRSTDPRGSGSTTPAR